jgi:hypothetical protein
MSPARCPVAVELFAQWQRRRGGRTEPASQPFSRNWEELLEAARIVSAIERADAERDARALAAEGWVELKTVRYRAHLLERIVLPLAAEARWREAFGFIPPSENETRQIRAFAWEPALAFLREARVNIPFEELRRLNEFIQREGTGGEVVPIKERSLQIFGDEKRLDQLLASALFREARLALRRDLRCEQIGMPFGWKRGPAVAAAQPIIVLENAATWHSYCRWNSDAGLFSAVIYGDGNRFVDGLRYLPDLFAELGGARRICYFGDLDPQGLLIPQEASTRNRAANLPPVEPHLWSYRALLEFGETHAQPWEGETPSPTLCDWLEDCGEAARRIFARGRRLAQEHLGWEFLRQKEVAAAAQ